MTLAPARSFPERAVTHSQHSLEEPDASLGGYDSRSLGHSWDTMTGRTSAGRLARVGLRGVRGRRRRIVTTGDADAGVLRARSKRVRAVDTSIRKLIADMLATMRGASGVGLAAPQIGVPLRVIVAEIGRDPLALVNPRLRRRWGSQVGPEGCLSIPGLYADVRRALGVVVEGYNARGRRVVVRGRGLLARALQHEVDHLNGVLLTDRIPGRRFRTLPPRTAPRRRAGASPRGRVGIVHPAAARRLRPARSARHA